MQFMYPEIFSYELFCFHNVTKEIEQRPLLLISNIKQPVCVSNHPKGGRTPGSRSCITTNLSLKVLGRLLYFPLLPPESWLSLTYSSPGWILYPPLPPPPPPPPAPPPPPSPRSGLAHKAFNCSLTGLDLFCPSTECKLRLFAKSFPQRKEL